jgi:hypothetical protein
MSNNPIWHNDVLGDSINTVQLYKKNNGTYIHQKEIQALEFFASTKIGYKFLGFFASKGQKIGNVTFNKDGIFHKQNIDLNFDTDLSVNDGRTGEVSSELDKNKRFQITLSFKSASDMYCVIETLVHEFFIHAYRRANDFSDNGKRDHSNINSYIKKHKRRIQWEHYQEYFDAKNKKSIFGNYGYPILIKANKQYKKHENNSEIWNSMWNFLF